MSDEIEIARLRARVAELEAERDVLRDDRDECRVVLNSITETLLSVRDERDVLRAVILSQLDALHKCSDWFNWHELRAIEQALRAAVEE